MSLRSVAGIAGLLCVLATGVSAQSLMAVGTFAVGLGLEDAIGKCGFKPSEAQLAALSKKIAGLRQDLAGSPGLEGTVRENLPRDAFPCADRAAFEQALADYVGPEAPPPPAIAAAPAAPENAAPAPRTPATVVPAAPPPAAASPSIESAARAPAPATPADVQSAIAGAIAAAKTVPTRKAKSPRDLMIQGMLIEVGADVCEIELDEDDAEQLGQAIQYLRGKADLRRTQMDRAKEALETEAKKNRRAFCADFKRQYAAELKEALAAAE